MALADPDQFVEAGDAMSGPTLLSYDSPTRPTPTVWLHYVALACGLIPLGIGTALFVLFLTFRTEDVALLGFITIFVGSCLAFVGFACIGVYYFQARRAAPEDAAVARRRVLIDLGIITANFPIAFGMAWGGLWLMSRVTITIHNRDAAPIEEFRIATDYEGTHDLGTIEPNATKSITLSDEDFDQLEMSFVHEGKRREESVSAYSADDGKLGLSIKNGKLVED
jgi:hypothetical protein